MKLGEFMERFNVQLRYSKDRSLVNRNKDVEILAYAVSYSGSLIYNWDSSRNGGYEFLEDKPMAYGWGFIVKTQKICAGFINGVRKNPVMVYKFIKQFKSEVCVPDEAKVKQELILGEVLQ